MSHVVAPRFVRQRGAALVVGLLLLLVLTLLAISGMNTASLELVMAGNEQYRQNAFQAAEAGIEHAIRDGEFNPSATTETLTFGEDTDTSTVPYAVSIATQLNGLPQGAIWGNSWNSFSTYHFEINSDATSQTRGARATHTQGIALLAPFSPSVGAAPDLGTTVFAPSASP